MKNLFLTLMMALTSYMSYAIGYGKYSLPHTTSESELQRYVGQKVRLFPCDGEAYLWGDKKGHDEKVFRQVFKGVVNHVYTIKKVKVGKQIVFDLDDGDGKIIKAKVNIDHTFDFKGMQTCESFFLVDQFEKDKATMLGSTINNYEGKAVAKVIDVIMAKMDREYPDLRLLVQTSPNGGRLYCTKEQAEKVWSEIGKTISSPKVKKQFQVVDIKDYNKLYNGGVPSYIVQNVSDPNEKRTGTIVNPESTIFKEDLSGRYVSILSKVEKPSNPTIRYGKTTTVNDKNVSRYSYVDNIIDILIFGSSTQFDFILKNVSDNSIKVIWNEAVFVNYDGTTSKVIHAGTRYSQREADQPSTTIIKGAKIEDIAAPNCYIRYSETLKEWVKDSMYPSAPDIEPGQLRLMLPIQIKDVINEYVFIFDVKYVYNHPEVLTFL